MYIGLFYINKENNPNLMGESMHVIHILFGLLILGPSFAYIFRWLNNILIQLLVIVYLNDTRLFSLLTVNLVNKASFYRTYIAPEEDKQDSSHHDDDLDGSPDKKDKDSKEKGVDQQRTNSKLR